MNTEAAVASMEVDTFEEYTLYSLERSTPGLLRLMERSKMVARAWPGIIAFAEAASICQELAALAGFQDTISTLFQFEEVEGETGARWQRLRARIKLVMDSLEDSLHMNDDGATRRLFAVEVPDTLNLFVDLIPDAVRHVRETFVELIPAEAGV